uniref:Ig-like domain-containing protein n=1 Tax=Oryzias latipes TaxID=8090 RepID=A0A3P9JZC4_ORYLA
IKKKTNKLCCCYAAVKSQKTKVLGVYIQLKPQENQVGLIRSQKSGGKQLTVASKPVGFCKRDLAVCSGSYQAYFGEGTRLTVLEPGINVTAPTRVKVLSPSEKECSSGTKTLVCVASGFYPDHVSVSWMINEETVSKGVATDSAATRYGTSYRITSRLTVSSEEWTSDIKFVCSVSFFNGTTTTYYNDSITGEAKKIPSGTELSRDKYLRITQSAKLSYIIFIVKSCIYGAFIWFVAWKLQSLAEKKRKR